ncbi:hypothetical protein [Streptomyces sp. NPDC090025]|uniref:hypothetical protein n=1 Tax=Streptomyces sp. NPDC090025 TaxID=3365922 RepID=UPI003833298A
MSEMSDVFRFGAHPEHGYVASAPEGVSAHLAHWLLGCVQFLPVPGAPAVYALTDPHADGARRTRRAVADLRRKGHRVDADYLLDPARSPDPTPPPQPPVPAAARPVTLPLVLPRFLPAA